MTRQDIDVAGYWKITIFYDVDTGWLNTGFTHSDTRKRRSVVVIGKSTSKRQFMNTMVHEMKHVQSAICRFYRVPEDGEDAAYLIGWIIQESYCFLMRFIK